MTPKSRELSMAVSRGSFALRDATRICWAHYTLHDEYGRSQTTRRFVSEDLEEDERAWKSARVLYVRWKLFDFLRH